MTNEYTPTTDEVRMAYGDSQCLDMDDPAHSQGCPQDEEFDRWLAEYTRQQREEAWAQGYADGQDSIYTAVDEWPNPDITNPYLSGE